MSQIDKEWVAQKVKAVLNAKVPASQEVVQHAIDEEINKLITLEKIASKPPQEITIINYN